jgi:oligosaccharide repeat unit polymerase
VAIVAAGLIASFAYLLWRQGGWVSLGFLFFVSLAFFQGVPLLIYSQFLEPERDYAVHATAIAVGAIGFLLAYTFAPAGALVIGSGSGSVGKLLGDVGRWIVVATFPLCLGIALNRAVDSVPENYGYEAGLSFLEQVFMYGAIVGVQFVYASHEATRRTERLLLAALVLLPRAIIAVNYARFYFLQALLPILVLEAVLLRASGQRLPSWLGIAATSLVVTFLLLPLYMRLGGSFGHADLQGLLEGFFIFGSSLAIFDYYLSAREALPDISYSVGALFYSVLPFLADGDYLIHLYDRELVNRLDRALTKLILTDAGDAYLGTGGNFLVDLYADGGYTGVLCGAIVIGGVTRYFERRFWIMPFSTFVAFHLISRLVYLPRGTFPEFFDRLVLLLAIWVLGVLLAQLVLGAWRGVGPQRPALPPRE